MGRTSLTLIGASVCCYASARLLRPGLPSSDPTRVYLLTVLLTSVFRVHRASRALATAFWRSFIDCPDHAVLATYFTRLRALALLLLG